MTALQAEPPVSSKGPLDATVVALQAADVLADALLEEGLPGHELEAEPTVYHREAPADEAGDAGEAATDILAGAGWHKGEAAVSRHPMADTLNLPSLKSRQGVDRDANDAILSGRKTHLHKSPSPTADSFVDLSAKTAVPDFRAVLGNNLSVEPSRTIAGNLPVEADGRERPYSHPVAALGEVVSLPALDDVLRDLPVIGIDPLDKAGPAQCFQAADMRAHIGLGSLP